MKTDSDVIIQWKLYTTDHILQLIEDNMQNFLCSYTYKYMRHFSVWSCYGFFFLFIHFILFYFFPMNMCRSYTKSGKSASHGLSRLHIPFLSSRVSGNCGLEQLTFCRLAPALAPAQPLPTSRASWKERPCKLPLLEEPAVNSELSSDHICQESGCSVPWNTCQVPRHPGDGMCWKCGRSP